MTYRELLKGGQKYLLMAGIHEADINTWYIFSHVLNIDRSKYFLLQDQPLEERHVQKIPVFEQMIKKRSTHIPLEHLLGYQEFMGLNFYVNEDVLIPRQDTETLVEEVIHEIRSLEKQEVRTKESCLVRVQESVQESAQDRIQERFHENQNNILYLKPPKTHHNYEGTNASRTLLDICTGSGCIGLSLAKRLGVKVTLTDLSADALEAARKNASLLGVDDAEFFVSDMFDQIPPFQFDIITANPPYIPTKVVETLMEEVRGHEPFMALDGKEDGLHFYRIIAAKSKEYLSPDGFIFLEIGHDQGQPVSRLMQEHGYKEVMVIQDITGHDRVIKARRSHYV